jgi:hypothetical protein
MKISAKLGIILSAIFTLACLAVAVKGFMSLDEIADPAQLSDAKGYIGYWLFLSFVGVLFGVLTWWSTRLIADDSAG